MKHIGFIAFLFKFSPVILKFLKSAKVIKAGLAAGSFAAYSYLFTWEFAIVLLAAIVFHEYGHTQGMKKMGIPVKGIYLIPFLGGAAVPEKGFDTRTQETHISLWGPWYGLLMCIPFLVYGVMFNNVLAIGLVSFMALLNLFNLFPINPLDGGRVAKSIAFSFHSNLGFFVMVGGIVVAGLLVWYLHIWVLLFVIVIGAIELAVEYFQHKKQKTFDIDYERQILEDKKLKANEFSEEFKLQYLEKIELEEKQLEELYEQIRIKNNDLTIKNMNKNDILVYSSFYVFLILSFVGLIYFSSTVEGADLALKIIKDDL